jgi:predicted NBD/HSP70 family sugar kinase
MKDTSELTDNTRRIITLLKRNGPLPKGELAQLGNMGWATVVKVINQLAEDGMVKRLGTVTLDNGKKGKRAYLYDLIDTQPLAIGVDIEYQTTTIVLTNLKGNVLASAKLTTVNSRSDQTIRTFLLTTISEFLEAHAQKGVICGVGIGIPGIGFPTNSRLDNIKKMKGLMDWLSHKLQMPVQVNDNTKAYAIFEKWNNETFPQENFIFVSVRTGVGTGIFYHGNLYLGTRGLAGEVGHIQVDPDGRPCRCGNRGCLETILGEQNLYREYCLQVLQTKNLSGLNDPQTLEAGLTDLFARASRGEEPALSIVHEAAVQLGRGLAHTIMVLDISNVVISGHFGPHAEVLLDPMRKFIGSHLLPGTSCTIKYLPFDPQGHVQGAALLILKDYFIDIQSEVM